MGCSHMGVVPNSFARKWLLRRPWANLARFLRTTVPFALLVEHIFVPRFKCFSCNFLECIDIHELLIDFPLNPKGNQRLSKIFNSCACPRIFLSENICSSSFTYITLYFHFHACVFDRAAWTTGQLWT